MFCFGFLLGLLFFWGGGGGGGALFRQRKNKHIKAKQLQQTTIKHQSTFINIMICNFR